MIFFYTFETVFSPQKCEMILDSCWQTGSCDCVWSFIPSSQKLNWIRLSKWPGYFSFNPMAFNVSCSLPQQFTKIPVVHAMHDGQALIHPLLATCFWFRWSISQNGGRMAWIQIYITLDIFVSHFCCCITYSQSNASVQITAFRAVTERIVISLDTTC